MIVIRAKLGPVLIVSVVTPANATKDTRVIIVNTISTSAKDIHPASMVCVQMEGPIILALASRNTAVKIVRWS